MGMRRQIEAEESESWKMDQIQLIQVAKGAQEAEAHVSTRHTSKEMRNMPTLLTERNGQMSLESLQKMQVTALR